MSESTGVANTFTLLLKEQHKEITNFGYFLMMMFDDYGSLLSHVMKYSAGLLSSNLLAEQSAG